MRWSSSPTTRNYLARQCDGAPGGEPSQAVAQGHVVHSQSRCRLRRPHGRHTRPHAETPDPERPVMCFDESPNQLIGEIRQPISAAPGGIERYDCEYHRNGTVNLFVFLDANKSWRNVKVTEHRAAADFAQCMRDLVDVHYPEAHQIRVVLDNLSTHSAAAIYETFHACEARCIFRRLESSTPPGSTWSRSKSVSSAASASTAASAIAICSAPRSLHGRKSETPPGLASTGCSQSNEPGQKWPALAPSSPTSHNSCAGVLAARRRRFVPNA
jgi:hypothetical protein